MPPKLVLCHCCECGCVALSVCTICERAQLRAQLHALLLRRDASTNAYVRQAWDALVESYRLDSADETDRAMDSYWRDGTHQ